MKSETFKVGEILNPETIGQRSFDINDLHKVITRANKIWLMSWAFRNPLIIVSDYVYRFRVSGHHHKGYVYIILGWDDTFTIYYTTLKNKVKKIAEMVYIDVYFQKTTNALDTLEFSMPIKHRFFLKKKLYFKNLINY